MEMAWRHVYRWLRDANESAHQHEEPGEV
jgi:hypothetical protein